METISEGIENTVGGGKKNLFSHNVYNTLPTLSSEMVKVKNKAPLSQSMAHLF